ncbi:MAG TPA: DUF4258 domain-containing protein [Candidatus Tripitaka sp. YC43]
MISSDDIRKRVGKKEYEISLHAEKERYVEDITISDIESVIDTGEVLEYYPGDPRGKSCLVLGYSRNRPIHIVCGYTRLGWVRIITVYIPKAPKWLDERTRRKGK